MVRRVSRRFVRGSRDISLASSLPSVYRRSDTRGVGGIGGVVRVRMRVHSLRVRAAQFVGALPHNEE